MKHPKPPPHLVSLSDDDRLGFLLVASLLLAGPGISHYFGWADLLGTSRAAALVQLPMTLVGLTLLFFCIRQLFRPGCRIMLRINHGGVTDFRLSDQPIPWHSVLGASRLSVLGVALPVILLDLEPALFVKQTGTFWYRLLHFWLHRQNSPRLILLCGSLDSPTDEVFFTIQAHLIDKRQRLQATAN
ncbi:MAG: hypothetical protein HQL72_09680 [Magnetococcales bacterium]|nr:hypothetical protein [Magnetococcales bacterium]